MTERPDDSSAIDRQVRPESTDLKSDDHVAKSALRRLVGDSGALLIANLVFLCLGILRTKLAAVELGPKGLGAVTQMTQLSNLVVFICALGLGTGTRLALARANLNNDERARAGKRLVLFLLAVTLPLTALCAIASGPLADLVLGSAHLASILRIALLSIPASAATQLVLPIAQAWRDFRNVALAAIATGIVGSAATVPMLATHKLALAVGTIPVAAAVQLICLVLFCPSIRRTLRARPEMKAGLLHEIISVGGLSFAIGSAATLFETIVRVVMVRIGGLGLVGAYQPITLLSTSGFGLIGSSIGTALLVHVAGDARSTPAKTSVSLNEMLRTTTLIVGTLGFGILIGVRIYIPLMFSSKLLPSASAVAYHVPVEVITATVWIFGAALLPLKLRKSWLVASVANSFIEMVVIAATVGTIGLIAVPLGSGVGWTLGLGVTLFALRTKEIGLSASSALLAAWTAGLQLVGAASLGSGRSYSLAVGPMLAGVVWITPLSIGLIRRRAKRGSDAV